MNPVPLARLPEEIVGGRNRAGHLKVAGEHLGEIEQLGHFAGRKVDRKDFVLHRLALGVLGQGQQLAVLPEADVVVQLVAVQLIHLHDLPQPVDARELGRGYAGDDVVFIRKHTVQAVAFQHHLIAQDTGVVVHKAVAQVAVDAHHGEKPVGQRRPGAAVGGFQRRVIAGFGLGHRHGETHGLAQVAPGTQDLQRHFVGLARHQADQLQFVHAAVGLAARVGGDGGEIGDALILHMHGVAHAGGHVGREIQVQPVAAGAERVDHRQRVVGRPGRRAVLERLQRRIQPLLHAGIVEGETLLLKVVRHQVQRAQAAFAQVGLGVFDALLVVAADHLARVDLPFAAHHALLRGEQLGHAQHHERRGDSQHRHHGQHDQRPFLFAGVLCGWFHFAHKLLSLGRLPGGQTNVSCN